MERPQEVEGEDSQAFTQPDYEREQAHLGLMPSTQDHLTIGHLYEAIRVNLIALERDLGATGLFIGDAAGQVGRVVIDLEGVEPIATLAAAQRAIDIIVEQGEGSSADSDVSHYRSFLTIQRDLEAEMAKDCGFAPAWPVADSPVLQRPPEPEGKVFVDHPDAAPLLDFACASYGLLLRCLAQCFGRSGADAQTSQTALMDAAIDLMHALDRLRQFGGVARGRVQQDTTVAQAKHGHAHRQLHAHRTDRAAVHDPQVLTQRLGLIQRGIGDLCFGPAVLASHSDREAGQPGGDEQSGQDRS